MNRVFKVLIGTIAALQIFTIGASAVTYRASDFSELDEDIFNNGLNRVSEYSFIYTGDTDNIKSELISYIQKVYSKDAYLNKSWSRIGYNAEQANKGVKIKVTTNFITTGEEEVYIDEKLHAAVDSIINVNMTDYQKVRAINDYLVNLYEYDYDLLERLDKVNAGETKDVDEINQVYKDISVYTALNNHNTVCQGYSMTAYKMMKYAGLECDIIEGKLNDGVHIWNSVKINGALYYIDITNNDTSKSDKYFLVSKEFLEAQGYTVVLW